MNPPSTLTTSWASFSGRQHSALEWETHYELIKTLYLVRDLKLWQIKDIMAREHGFRATDAQYKRFIAKNKLEKNVKHGVREWITAKSRRRSLEGKDTQACLNGRAMRMERLNSWKEETEDEDLAPRINGSEPEIGERARQESSYPSTAGPRSPTSVPRTVQRHDAPRPPPPPRPLSGAISSRARNGHRRSSSNPTAQALRRHADRMLNKLELEDFHSGYAFNHQEALDFLVRNSSGALCPSSPAAHAIVSTLSTSFPALELAGSYISLQGVSAEEYLTLLRSAGKGLGPVLSAFEISFTALQRAEHSAADLLLTCGFLHHSHIPHVLLQRASPVQDSPTLEGLLATLKSYRLVRPDTFNRSFSVDAAIHAHLRKLAAPDEGLRCLRMLRTAVSSEGKMFGNRILPHVKACQRHLKRFEHQADSGDELREGLTWLAAVVEGAG